MRAKKLIITVLIITAVRFALIYPAPTLGADDIPLEEIGAVEQQLLEEVLSLDARLLRWEIERESLARENLLQKEALEKKRRELSGLDGIYRERQQELGRLLRFSYEGGHANFMAILLGSETLGDFFRRADYVFMFMGHYNDIILDTRAIIADRRREELEIVENRRRIEELEAQAQHALEEIGNTLAQKQEELAKARVLLADTRFLDSTSEKWQEALPSLDYLLRNLSDLPWSSLSPDDLKVNYLTFTARAEFEDESLQKKLLSGDDRLANVSLEFDSEGITVAEQRPGGVPLYSITCAMVLTEDQRIKFMPRHLEFNGITLAPRVIEELMEDYTMMFTPPTLPFDLKITSISTEKGKLIMYLKR